MTPTNDKLSRPSGSFSKLTFRLRTACLLGVAGSTLLAATPVAAGEKLPSLYSDAELKALMTPAPFVIQGKDISGMPVTTINGAAENGLDVANLNVTPEMIAYFGAISRAMGFNSLVFSYRDKDGEGLNSRRVTPQHLTEAAGILRNMGLGFSIRNYSEGWASEDFWPQLGIDQELIARWRRGMPNPKLRNWGDILSRDFLQAKREIYKAEISYLAGHDNFLAYNPIDELEGAVVPSPTSPEGRAHFQAFAAGSFGDASPDADSNKDGSTYNQTFGTAWTTWGEVESPKVGENNGTHDYRGVPPSMQRFYSLFAAQAWSPHIGELARLTKSFGPNVIYHYAQPVGENISLLAATDGPTVVDPSVYTVDFNFCQYAGASWLFGKPSLASWINVFNGNYDTVRNFGVRALPYTFRFLWWHMVPGRQGEGMWGKQFNLALAWQFQGPPPKWPEPVNAVVELDPRTRAVGELAPFIGRFSSVDRLRERGVLWVEPNSADLNRIVDDYWVSEEVLSLYPDRIPWDRLRVVIYSPGSGALDRSALETLRRFVQKGGTVLIDPARLSSAPDYLGRDNSAWLKGAKVESALPRLGPVLFSYEDSFPALYRWYSDRRNLSTTTEWPGPEDNRGVWMMAGSSKEGSFEYHFEIPKGVSAVLLENVMTTWAGPSRARVDYQWRDQDWRPVFDLSKNYTIHDVKKVLRLDPAAEPGTLKLRYTLRDDRPPTKDEFAAKDPRNVTLRSIKLTGLRPEEADPVENTLKPSKMRLKAEGIDCALKESYDLAELPKDGRLKNPRGVLVTNDGRELPLFADLSEGKGRWILAACSGLFGSKEDAKGRRELLNLALRDTGVQLLDSEAPYILQSLDKGALLAWRMAGKNAAFASVPVKAETTLAQPLVFDVFERKIVPFEKLADGSIEWKADLSGANSNKIWLIKDASQPLLICADGTLKYGLKIADGNYSEESVEKPAGFNPLAWFGAGGNKDSKTKRLEFECAEEAWVYAPAAPLEVTSKEGRVSHQYDSEAKILKISGPGVLSQVTVTFP